MRFLIVRHGETDWNKRKLLQGATDIPLNKAGVLQAESVAARLKNMRIDDVITSPLQRACETGKRIAQAGGFPLSSSDALSEMNLDIWEGMTFEQIALQYPDTYKTWSERPDLCRVSDAAECMEDVAGRLFAWVEEVYRAKPEATHALVTHSLPAKLLIAHALGLEFRFLHRFRLNNASMSIVERRREGWNVRLINDISHMRRN